MRGLLSTWVALLALAMTTLALAQAPPGDFVSDIVFDSPNGINALEFDHLGHLLVLEKQGRVLRLEPNGSGGFVTPPTVFADLTSQVVPTFESGLLGFALDPDYANNGTLYLFYTSASDQRLTRISANATFDAMQPDSEVILLQGLPRASFIHKAGDIHFAPSDPTAIYVSLGDDGFPALAQNPDRYEGKMLRVDAATGLGLPDNPFFDGDADSIASRIFALGLRNPFRFTFHPDANRSAVPYSSENGDAVDRLSWVGEGSNGAWSPAGDAGGFLDPPDANHRVLATWSPSVVGVAISSGGPFGTDVLYWGQWQGNLRRWQLQGNELDEALELDGGLAFRTGHPTIALKFGPDGHLYSCSSGNDAAVGGYYPVRRLRYVGTPQPTAAFSTHPDPAEGLAPLQVDFVDQSIAPGSTIISRQWQFGDGNNSSATNPSHVYQEPGVYMARLEVSNSVGQQASASRAVRVTRAVEVSFTGLVRDARQLAAPPLASATELRFYQADGSTPAAFPGGLGADGNALAVAAGGSNTQQVSLQLTGDGVVISAGESNGDGLQSARRGWVLDAGAGPHTVSGDFNLAATLLRGRLQDTREQPVSADIGLRREAGTGSEPYALSGGRDYLPGSSFPPSGVSHRVDSDALGWFHLPVRDADADAQFIVDAVGDTANNSHAPIQMSASLPSGDAVDLSLRSGLWSGGIDCDVLDGIGETPMVDYASEIQPIFDQGCIGCHTAVSSNSGGLDLTASASSLELVAAPSSGAPGVPRVQPGEPLRSFLFEKINCAQPQTGTRMRPANSLPLASQALIRDWITQLPAGDAVFGDGFE